MTSMARREFLAGVRAMTPWLAGVAPFGLVIGVSAAHTDIPTGAGWLTGPTIYAGSAQVAAIQMLGAGAAPVAVIMTVIVINLRLVIYSAAMAPYWRGMPLWWRLLGGYLLVDPSFVVGIQRYGRGRDARPPEPARPDRRGAHAYYLGGAMALWVAWIASITLGATAGGRLPASLHLELVVPLFLLGECVPKLRQQTTRRTVLAAAVVAAVTLAVPMHLGIMLAILAGVAAGSIGSAGSAGSAGSWRQRSDLATAVASPSTEEAHR